MLTPWKESYDEPRQHIKKQRHYFVNKDPSSQGYSFSMVMYGCESWTVKKAEHWRIDAFELWCWTKLLRVPWTARRSNQSILKEISTGCSLEELTLKLKLQYSGHLMWRSNSPEKTLMIEGGRRRGWQRMRWLDGITNLMGMSLSKLWSWWCTGRPGVLQSVGSQRVRHDLSDWTELILANMTQKILFICLYKWKQKWKLLSPLQLFATPWNIQSTQFSRPESSLSLLQGIFPTQRSNPGLLHCRWIFYQLSHPGRPEYRSG